MVRLFFIIFFVILDDLKIVLGDKVISIGLLDRIDHFFLGDVGIELDVEADTAIEHDWFLLDDSEKSPQSRVVVVTDVYSVNHDAPLLRLVEPQQ